MSDGVKYSEHILVDFEKTNLSFPCLRFIKLHQTSFIVGCQQSCRVFRKTAPLTTFHQVDIVYLYIGQHNNICFFSSFRRKGPFSPTFCKHANFSEEVARRILNSEFLTVRFLFRKDRERGGYCLFYSILFCIFYSVFYYILQTVKDKNGRTVTLTLNQLLRHLPIYHSTRLHKLC